MVGEIAVRIGVASRVEPLAGSMFAVMWRSEQAINDSLVGVWRGVGKECVKFGRRRRQPRDIKRESPEKCLFVCRWRRPYPSCLQSSHNEPINFVCWPLHLGHGRNGWPLEIGRASCRERG